MADQVEKGKMHVLIWIGQVNVANRAAHAVQTLCALHAE